MTKLTDQEILEAVAKHLFKQGRRSIRKIETGGQTCAYRGDHNCSCAVGGLIRDDEYRPEMDDNILMSNLKAKLLEEGKISSLDARSGTSSNDLLHTGLLPERLSGNPQLLRALQATHDNGLTVDEDEWFTSEDNIRNTLRRIGLDYRLHTGFLDDLKLENKYAREDR